MKTKFVKLVSLLLYLSLQFNPWSLPGFKNCAAISFLDNLSPKSPLSTQLPFPQKLRMLREAKGLTKSQLAKRAGLGASSIFYYEEGKHIPGPKNAKKLAKALGVSMQNLLPNPSLPKLSKEELLKLSIGKRIYFLRLQNGLTKVQLAKKVGLSPALLSRYEQGKSIPAPSIAEKLAKALGVKTQLLLYNFSDKELLKLSIRERIFFLRLQSGLSPVDLAKKAGLSSQLLYQYEKGHKIPTRRSAKKLAKPLRVSKEFILGIMPIELTDNVPFEIAH